MTITKYMINTKKIKRILKKKGIKQLKIAEILRIDQTALSQFINGHRFISEIRIVKIAKFLKVRINEIV